MSLFNSPHRCLFRVNQVFLMLFLLHSLLMAQDSQEQKKTKKAQVKPPVITEEILVVGEAPNDRPVSTVTTLNETQIEHTKPLDLAEIIRYAPGVSVTFGDKSVYTLKLRGVDDRRIALLVDGIPVYEPYYSSFDLKTISADGIDSLQLTKGPSSVLYGANTMGGIVNVVTQRPEGRPQLSLNASYGESNTKSLGARSGVQIGRWAFSGTLLYQDSGGFYFPDEAGGSRLERSNSDYERLNVNGKLYFNPTDRSEVMLNAGLYSSSYSMPPALESSKPRYWQFKNWNRLSLNAGGFSGVGKDSVVRFRAFFVDYDNTLAMFDDQELTQMRFESTHDNAVYGMFGLADLGIHPNNRLKFSFDYKGDDARTQEDVGAPWEEYDQLTVSFAVEDHLTFLDIWQLVAGVSYDYLDKFTGESTGNLNPLVGIRYTPREYLDLHLSYSLKSRFPSMRSMYSSPSGNPDLLSESGSILELGFEFTREVQITGAVFLMSFKDLIDSVRLPEYDFQRRYFNIAAAHINGFELSVQKSLRQVSFSANYTFLDHRNETDDSPLMTLSDHSLNFDVQIFPLQGLRWGILGLWASDSHYLLTEDEIVDIPAYFNLDSILAFRWDKTEIFLKATNLLNTYIYSEPGFPWRGRYFELGIRADLF
jgi:outer membrane cobalamin receptor